MQRPEPTNSYERRLVENIATYGWQSTYVSCEAPNPAFAYTIGLHSTHGIPEFIIFGLPRDVAHSIFAEIASAAAAGKPVPLKGRCETLMAPYPCELVPVPRRRYKDYVLSAIWWEQGDAFPLLQIVWTDASSRFPWDPHFSEDCRDDQPVLGPRPGAA